MWSDTVRRFVVPPAIVMLLGAIAAPECGAWLRQARAQSGDGPGAASQAQSATTHERNEDRAAIRAALDSFAKAFESRDPKALAVHWTSGGEYHPLDGARVQGREALEKGFTSFFARTPEPQARIQHESLRFLSNDSAI